MNAMERSDSSKVVEKQANKAALAAAEPVPDVADDAAQIGLEPAEASVGALELMGMGIALMLDKRQLADPRIGLAQLDTDMRGRPYQALSRSV